jgi:hypothetical protein
MKGQASDLGAPRQRHRPDRRRPPLRLRDAFELRREGPDRCSPEEWVRAGVVDASPAWTKRIAGHADGLGSARIGESDADGAVCRDGQSLSRCCRGVSS